MQVGLCVPWEIKVDDDVDRKNINTTSKDVCADQTSGLSIFEVMVDSIKTRINLNLMSFNLPISVILLHFRVDVEARVSQLSDLFGQQLNSFGVFTKNDCLVNVQLGEKSVQAVELFSLLEVCVILSYTL